MLTLKNGKHTVLYCRINAAGTILLHIDCIHMKCLSILSLTILRSCKKWGVVTTIFGTAPSEAVRRFLYRRSNWCVVVVGDKGKPDSARTFDYLILNCITEFK